DAVSPIGLGEAIETSAGDLPARWVIQNPADFLSPSLRLLYPLQQRWSKNAQLGLTNNDFAHDPTLHSMQPMLVSRTKGGIELFNLPVPTRSEDLAVLQYTGGTTGRSKG